MRSVYENNCCGSPYWRGADQIEYTGVAETPLRGTRPPNGPAEGEIVGGLGFRV